MDSNVQSIAANAEESASVAYALNAQIRLLQQTIQKLVAVTGASGMAIPQDQRDTNQRMLPATTEIEPCWVLINCPDDRRDSCPAYPDYGDKCWMVTGTSCEGVTHDSLHEKMETCRGCRVYKSHVG